MTMLPLILKIKIINENRRGIRLWLPIFLVWIVLIFVMLLLFPLVLIAAVIAIPFGYARTIILLGPYFIRILCSLRGLKVDVNSESEIVYIQFI